MEKKEISLRMEKKEISLRMEKKEISLRMEKKEISLRTEKKEISLRTTYKNRCIVVFTVVLLDIYVNVYAQMTGINKNFASRAI